MAFERADEAVQSLNHDQTFEAGALLHDYSNPEQPAYRRTTLGSFIGLTMLVVLGLAASHTQGASQVKVVHKTNSFLEQAAAAQCAAKDAGCSRRLSEWNEWAEWGEWSEWKGKAGKEWSEWSEWSEWNEWKEWSEWTAPEHKGVWAANNDTGRSFISSALHCGKL